MLAPAGKCCSLYACAYAAANQGCQTGSDWHALSRSDKESLEALLSAAKKQQDCQKGPWPSKCVVPKTLGILVLGKSAQPLTLLA